MIGIEYQRWVCKLLGFDFEIQYKAGHLNQAANAFSRRPVEAACGSLMTSQWRDWDKLKTELDKDDFLQRIMLNLTQGTMAHFGFELRDGLLFFKGRLVVPRTFSLIPLILTEFHSTPIGGHLGETKTYQRIALELYWVGMRSDIAKFVVECDTCQRNKALSATSAGLLQPIPLRLQVWEEITMDFIEGLPKVDGSSTILVVVDCLSKYAHFICLKHPFSAQSVVALFVIEIVRLHGIPSSIISDRGQIFLSHFWKEIFWL